MSEYYFINRTINDTDMSVKSQDIDHSFLESIQSIQKEYSTKTKLVVINERDKIIFARYNSYIMLPWFVLSDILNEFDEEKIKILVNCR